MKQAHYDLVILGSAAALRAQALGKTSVMTEERTTGGTCVNRGCLPSKNLIEAAKIIHDALHPRYPGLSPAEVKLNFRELIAQKDDVIRSYRKKKYESLVGGRLTIEKGHVEFIDGHTVQVDGNQITGARILIATGSRPVIPNIVGLRDTAGMIKMLANDETEEVLGVSMVGNSAGEVIHEAAMAMHFHAKINDFIELLHVYPTMAEALKIAAISRRKDPTKLSCCAE